MLPIVYKPVDRPEVEVAVDGVWYYGLLRMWTRDDTGAWSGQVTWPEGPGMSRIDRFPSALIRELTVDGEP